jgi:hypothetical protein
MGLLEFYAQALNSTAAANTDEYIGIVACSTTGPVGDFVTVTDIATLKATFGTGPAVVLAEPAINAGKAVAIWREPVPVLAYGSPATVVSGGGTLAAATYDASVKPTDRSFASVQFTAAGTIGTAGIKYKLARVLNPTDADYGAAEYDLGTALFILTPDNIRINLTTGQTVTALSRITNAEGRMPAVDDATVTAAIVRIGTSDLRIRNIIIGSEVTTGAKLTAFNTAAVALETRSRRPHLFACLPAATLAQTPAAWITATQAITSGIVADLVTVVATEATGSSPATDRTVLLYSVMVSVIDKLARTTRPTDLRCFASKAAKASEAAAPDGVAGPTIQTITSPATNTPLGGWDDSRGKALSNARVLSLRKINSDFLGTFIADAPTLSAPNTALQNVSHARVLSAVYQTACIAGMTYLGHYYETMVGAAQDGRLVPAEVDAIQDGIKEYVDAAHSREYQSFAVTIDRTDSISDGALGGFITLTALRTLEKLTLPITFKR